MDDQEEKFTLRDKLAIELLKLTYQHKDGPELFSDYIKNVTINKSDYEDYSSNFIKDLKGILDFQEKEISRRLHGAYKLADLMRKARLVAFE